MRLTENWTYELRELRRGDGNPRTLLGLFQRFEKKKWELRRGDGMGLPLPLLCGWDLSSHSAVQYRCLWALVLHPSNRLSQYLIINSLSMYINFYQ